MQYIIMLAKLIQKCWVQCSSACMHNTSNIFCLTKAQVLISAAPDHTFIPPLHIVTGASPPTNLSAEPTSPTSIRVSWTPPASGATVVGYRIYYHAEGSQDNPTNHSSVDVGASAAQHALSLQGGVLYTITLVTMSQYLPSTVTGPVTVTLRKFS